jgi:hypothetical protein
MPRGVVAQMLARQCSPVAVGRARMRTLPPPTIAAGGATIDE